MSNTAQHSVQTVAQSMRDYGVPEFWCSKVERFAPDQFIDDGKVWTLEVEGAEIGSSELGYIILASSDLGYIGIIHNGVYPTLFRWENGGGGVISVPYSVTDTGKVLYGFVEENRLNIHAKQQLVYGMGGFREKKRESAEEVETLESPTATAARESIEEGNLLLNWILVKGSNVVLDRATSVADATLGHGVETTVCEVPFSELQAEEDYYVFRQQPGELRRPVRFYTKLGAFENTIDSLVLVGITAVDVHRLRLN